MPSIEPVSPPYSERVIASFETIMPKGVPPLGIFRVLAHNPRVLERVVNGGLLDKGAISVRHRELVILRTCALCSAEYEWGVHARAFGPKAGLDDPALHATWSEGSGWTGWDEASRLVLRLTETLHQTNTVDDALYAELTAHFASDALIELVVLAGLYHAISFVVNAFGVANEAFAHPVPL